MSGLRRGRFFEGLPDASVEEQLETLAGREGVRIVRIVSEGQSSPEDFWYEQEDTEWVLLLTGRARLEVDVDGERQPIEMAPGDWLEIPRGLRHRVSWTDPEVQTLWLAVHF